MFYMHYIYVLYGYALAVCIYICQIGQFQPHIVSDLSMVPLMVPRVIVVLNVREASRWSSVRIHTPAITREVVSLSRLESVQTTIYAQ